MINIFKMHFFLFSAFPVSMLYMCKGHDVPTVYIQIQTRDKKKCSVALTYMGKEIQVCRSSDNALHYMWWCSFALKCIVTCVYVTPGWQHKQDDFKPPPPCWCGVTLSPRSKKALGSTPGQIRAFLWGVCSHQFSIQSQSPLAFLSYGVK